MRTLFARLCVALLAILGLAGAAFLVVEQFSSRLYYEELTQRLNAPIAMYVTGERQLISAGKIDHESLAALANQAKVETDKFAAWVDLLRKDALAAGVSDGLGYGYNTRAALITRGLAEITRIGVAMGAEPMTFAGLAGMGDLVLTCTDDQSRNRRMGLALAAGKTVKEAAKQIGLLQTKALRWHDAQPGAVVRNGCRGSQNPPKLDRKVKREL